MSDAVASGNCGHLEHQRRRREASVRDGVLQVASIDQDGNRTPWTQKKIPLPPRVPLDSFRVLSVVPHEWSTDLLVAYRGETFGPSVEVWRLSPTRLLGEPTVTDDVLKEMVSIECRPADAASPAEWELRLTSRDDLSVRTDSIRCRPTGSRVVPGAFGERKYDLFISYKSNDEALVSKVVEILLRHRVDLWFAPLRHKVNFARDVPRLIANAPYCLVMWSAGSEELWDRADELPKDPPYKQAHEIHQALREIHRTTVMVCRVDDSVVLEVVKDATHRFDRGEAERRAGTEGELSQDAFARAIADYVLTAMRGGRR